MARRKTGKNGEPEGGRAGEGLRKTKIEDGAWLVAMDLGKQ